MTSLYVTKAFGGIKWHVCDTITDILTLCGKKIAPATRYDHTVKSGMCGQCMKEVVYFLNRTPLP